MRILIDWDNGERCITGGTNDPFGIESSIMNLREVENLKSLYKKLDKTKKVLRSYSIVKVYYFVNIVIFLVYSKMNKMKTLQKICLEKICDE